MLNVRPEPISDAETHVQMDLLRAGRANVDEVAALRTVRGMAWLDACGTDWPTRVDPARLRIESPRMCMLGQRFAVEASAMHDDEGNDFKDGYDYALWLIRQERRDVGGFAVSHGFADLILVGLDGNDCTTDSEALNESWRCAIALRLAEAGASVVLP